MQLPSSKSAGNMMWFTDEDTPDPADLPLLRGWRLLIRPVPNAKKTRGGIIIPDQTLDVVDMLRCVGRVVTVGPLAYTQPDMLVNGNVDPWCKVGDYVLYPRYAGAKFSYGGVKFLILNDDEIMAVIGDPSKLNE
jgi:co-chaperonin GroES (HSP10)